MITSLLPTHLQMLQMHAWGTKVTGQYLKLLYTQHPTMRTNPIRQTNLPLTPNTTTY
jgi:hypothetical protein